MDQLIKRKRIRGPSIFADAESLELRYRVSDLGSFRLTQDQAKAVEDMVAGLIRDRRPVSQSSAATASMESSGVLLEERRWYHLQFFNILLAEFVSFAFQIFSCGFVVAFVFDPAIELVGGTVFLLNK